jgi:tetratricopeptide (TPR) repeat protein
MVKTIKIISLALLLGISNLMKALLYIFLWSSSLSILAQTPLLPFASTRESVKKADAALDNQDAKFLPLFGSKKKAEEQLLNATEFLMKCDKNFKDRVDASKFFAERGWEYLSEGLLDTATYRFNLCFLLNQDNVDAYWGLGSVSYQKGNYEESTKLLRKGLDLSPDNTTLMIDVATVQLACYKAKRNCDDIDDALRLLEKSLQKDPTNANGWLKFSIAEFQLEHYEKAWDYFHKCRMLDTSFIDTAYVAELLAKQPDPTGVFH